MTTGSTLLAPLLTPTLVSMLAGNLVRIDGVGLVVSTFQVRLGRLVSTLQVRGASGVDFPGAFGACGVCCQVHLGPVVSIFCF